jgi:hypothetical protein
MSEALLKLLHQPQPKCNLNAPQVQAIIQPFIFVSLTPVCRLSWICQAVALARQLRGLPFAPLRLACSESCSLLSSCLPNISCDRNCKTAFASSRFLSNFLTHVPEFLPLWTL